MPHRSRPTTAALLLIGLLAIPATGDDTATLSVSGTGESAARPDTAVLMAHVVGEAKLAEDAVVKWRDAKRRAMKAIDSLEIDGLDVTETGLAIRTQYDQQQINNLRRQPGSGNPTPDSIVATEGLRISLTGIEAMTSEQVLEKLLQVVSVSEDSGLSIGQDAMTVVRYGYNTQFGVFTFAVTDPADAIAGARDAAIADARSQAELLAEAAGVRIGKVIAVNQSVSHRSTNASPYPQAQQAEVVAARGVGVPMVTDAMGTIPVAVRVNLTYAIEPAEPASAEPTSAEPASAEPQSTEEDSE